MVCCPGDFIESNCDSVQVQCTVLLVLGWVSSAVGKKPVEYHIDLSVSSDAISASCLAAFGAPQGGML